VPKQGSGFVSSLFSEAEQVDQNHMPKQSQRRDLSTIMGQRATSAAAFVSLGDKSHVDNMLALMKNNLNMTQSNYFNSIGKRHSELPIKRKPTNVTPGGRKPYCRHKEFERMPKFSMDAVSSISDFVSSKLLFFVYTAMHKN